MASGNFGKRADGYENEDDWMREEREAEERYERLRVAAMTSWEEAAEAAVMARVRYTEKEMEWEEASAERRDLIHRLGMAEKEVLDLTEVVYENEERVREIELAMEVDADAEAYYDDAREDLLHSERVLRRAEADVRALDEAADRAFVRMTAAGEAYQEAHDEVARALYEEIAADERAREYLYHYQARRDL